MASITVNVEAPDNCDPEPTCGITFVTSTEPIDGLDDGDTAPDWEITGDLTVNLRAERSRSGSGRVYTISIPCTGVNGNSSTDSVELTVPHDRGKKKGNT